MTMNQKDTLIAGIISQDDYCLVTHADTDFSITDIAGFLVLSWSFILLGLFDKIIVSSLSQFRIFYALQTGN